MQLHTLKCGYASNKVLVSGGTSSKTTPFTITGMLEAIIKCLQKKMQSQFRPTANTFITKITLMHDDATIDNTKILLLDIKLYPCRYRKIACFVFVCVVLASIDFRSKRTLKGNHCCRHFAKRASTNISSN